VVIISASFDFRVARCGCQSPHANTLRQALLCTRGACVRAWLSAMHRITPPRPQAASIALGKALTDALETSSGKFVEVQL